MHFSDLFPQIDQHLNSAEKALLAVMGPTASGKSSLAVEIALRFDGEVINADSRQIYDEMEIGNERTKPEEMKGVPHHLLGTIPLQEEYNVTHFKRDAETLIEDISDRGKLPILCGGSTLWIDAVLDDFQFPQSEPDWERREELESTEPKKLLKMLREIDPVSADQLEPDMNPRYLARAIEIYEQTGKPKSEQASKGERKYDVLKIAPKRNREEIYDRIFKRTEYQFDHGMVPEVQALVDKYADGNPDKLLELRWPGLTSIGCKEVIPYLKGEQSREETIELLRRNNRRYAKRQLTWLRKDEEILWIDMSTK